MPFITTFFKGLLPRGEKPNPLREKMFAVNRILENRLADISSATYFGVDPSLFYVTGTENINRQDMWDFLHLTTQGYQKLCEPLLDEIQNLLPSLMKVENTSVETSSVAGELASDRP